MLQCSKTFVPFCFPYIQLCFGVFACCSVAKSTVFFPRNWASLGQCFINNLVGFITQTWQPAKQTRFVEGEQEFQRGTESTVTPALPTCMLSNVRSLENKLDLIQLSRSTQHEARDCCVFVFTETWLNDNTPDSNLLPSRRRHSTFW